jgi:CO/xanthine dehydrogenase FAD-binding subunit
VTEPGGTQRPPAPAGCGEKGDPRLAPRYDYHRPRTLDEAWSLRSSVEGSRYVCGGTDLIVRMRSGRESPRALISLRSLPELTGISMGEATEIGAATTFTDLLEHPALCARYPVLAQAARRIGCPQIRNVATIGGNLCNAIPCADSATALIVLDATLRARSPRRKRDIPVAEFFLGPRQTCLRAEEVLTSILLRPPAPTGAGIFLKATRVYRDLALASVAVFLEIGPDGRSCRKARVAAGSVSPVPLRLRSVESLFESEGISPETVSRAKGMAREAIVPISDVRASADYRRHLTGVLLGRAVETLANRERA